MYKHDKARCTRNTSNSRRKGVIYGRRFKTKHVHNIIRKCNDRNNYYFFSRLKRFHTTWFLTVHYVANDRVVTICRHELCSSDCSIRYWCNYENLGWKKNLHAHRFYCRLSYEIKLILCLLRDFRYNFDWFWLNGSLELKKAREK